MLRLHRASSGLLATSVCLAATLLLASGKPASGQTIRPPYNAAYTLTDLGSVPGLPSPYGALAFLPGNPNMIVIGGAADESSGAFYSIGVVRNAQSQITGFSGTAAFFSDGQFNDGGAVFGPGGVLFYTRYDDNEIGQVEPGSATTDKIIDLTPLGVSPSVGALNFVPTGFPGAGQLKILSYDTGNWYTAGYAPDGAGTYNITSATFNTTIQAGSEGFVYVPVGSPIFPASSMLVSEYNNSYVSIYQFDANGNPIPATRSLFIDGFEGPLGAVIDPLTGDSLFSSYLENRVIVVRGFASCVSDATTMCLNAGRFRVTADWRKPDGTSGQGQAVSLTSDSGYFWFFSSANIEAVVKVLNACAVNGHYWVFAAGLTNVEVTLRVVDTHTDSPRSYANPQGSAFQPIQDTSAFATCP